MSEAKSEDLHALATPEQLARMRRRWRLQHLGWALVAALVLAGAAGVFGSGPLSATTRSVDGLSLEFDRFIRRGAPFTLTAVLTVPPGASEARLSLSRRYFDKIRIEAMLPSPIQVVSAPEVVTFVFAVADNASALTLDIHCEAREAGLLNAEVATGDSRLRFTQFAWL
jgi:hypothetical protein